MRVSVGWVSWAIGAQLLGACASNADSPSGEQEGAATRQEDNSDAPSSNSQASPSGASPGDSDGADPDGAEDSAETGVRIQGGSLLVEGRAFIIQGVAYNPIPIGGTHPGDLDFAGFARQDIALMQAAGINTIRTYEPLTDVSVLDQLHEAGIYVINSVYSWGGAEAQSAVAPVRAVKNHHIQSPSSHCSPRSRIPFPQTGKGRQSSPGRAHA